jgi:ADP-heptose:LPS heptosyltransferase
MKYSDNIKDFLIFGHNYIGDVLTLTPAIRALKLKFPESRITAVVSKSASYVLRRNPDICRIIETEKINGIRGIAGIFKLLERLTALKKRTGINFTPALIF